jgi:hypothetical protein
MLLIVTFHKNSLQSFKNLSTYFSAYKLYKVVTLWCLMHAYIVL